MWNKACLSYLGKMKNRFKTSLTTQIAKLTFHNFLCHYVLHFLLDHYYLSHYHFLNALWKDPVESLIMINVNTKTCTKELMRMPMFHINKKKNCRLANCNKLMEKTQKTVAKTHRVSRSRTSWQDRPDTRQLTPGILTLGTSWRYGHPDARDTMMPNAPNFHALLFFFSVLHHAFAFFLKPINVWLLWRKYNIFC